MAEPGSEAGSPCCSICESCFSHRTIQSIQQRRDLCGNGFHLCLREPTQNFLGRWGEKKIPTGNTFKMKSCKNVRLSEKRCLTCFLEWLVLGTLSKHMLTQLTQGRYQTPAERDLRERRLFRKSTPIPSSFFPFYFHKFCSLLMTGNKWLEITSKHFNCS